MTERTAVDDTPTRHDESGPPARDVAAEQPFRIGRYTVIRRLGAGGMGVVYSAFDDELDRRVAIKLLHIDRSSGSLGKARMLREAQALAKLSHPNVVQVYEVDGAGDRLYLVMEFLAGLTLRAWLKSKAWSWREILEVYLQAGRGLAAAHAAGLVHRDFKPDNAIVGDDGRVRVLDFGLARVHDSDDPPIEPSPSWSALARAPMPVVETQGLSGPLTEAGTLLGTPAYMSPEQLLRRAADARSDQFSFCVALWEALYAGRPFAGRTLAELGPQVFAGPPRPPRGPAPAAIGRVLRRGLSPKPDDRFADMPALLAALTAAAQRGRRRMLASAAGLVVFAASAAGYALAGAGAGEAGRCDGAVALAGVWDPASREAVRGAVLATGAPFAADAWAAAERRLDGYAQDLQAMLDRACRLRQSRALADEVQALHEACLERRRAELAGVVGVLRQADVEAVRGAAQAAFGLGSPTRCADLAALRAEAERVRPPAPEQAQAVAGLRDRLAAAKAEQEAGRFARAREAAEAIVAEAERVGYAPLLAEALYRLGWTASATGDYAGARGHQHRAFALAEESGHDALAAASAVQLVHLHGVRLRELAPATAWQVLADAKLRRTGDDPALRIALLNSYGMALVEADRLSEGADMQRRALELAEARAAAAPLDHARVLNTLASTLTDQGRLEESEPLLQQALALRLRHLGPQHPDVAVVLHNLGKVLFLRRDFEAALVQMRRALEIRVRALGPQHPASADNLNALAVMLCDSGRVHECLGTMRRSVELVEAARGPDDPALVLPLGNLGNTLIREGDFVGAATHLERAMKILSARGEDEGLDAAAILYNLGLLALVRGEAAAAVDPLRRCLKIRTALLEATHVEVGYAASFLAEALLDSGKRAEAAVAARQASEVLAAYPEAAPELAGVRLVEAELLWPRDRKAARSLVEAAAAGLRPEAPDHKGAIEEVAAWLRAHAG